MSNSEALGIVFAAFMVLFLIGLVWSILPNLLDRFIHLCRSTKHYLFLQYLRHTKTRYYCPTCGCNLTIRRYRLDHETVVRLYCQSCEDAPVHPIRVTNLRRTK